MNLLLYMFIMTRICTNLFTSAQASSRAGGRFRVRAGAWLRLSLSETVGGQREVLQLWKPSGGDIF